MKRFAEFAAVAIFLCVIAIWATPPTPARADEAGTGPPASNPLAEANPTDTSQWFTVEPKVDKFAPTCIDQLTNLDAPAGKHGFEKSVDGHWEFEDGTPARMVGTLVNPPETKEKAAYLARFLAKYGFTLIRIGHLVKGPREESIVDWKRADTQHLNAAYMDKLDYFINELAKNGIYSRLTTFWYRQVKKGDGIDGFDEAVAWAKKKAKPSAKPPTPQELLEAENLDTVGITFFQPQVIALNIALEKELMAHRNPYRDNKMYGEDPAIAQLEVTNEDGMFFYTLEGIAPVYARLLDKMWTDWLINKYGSGEKLAAAWGNELTPKDSVAAGRIARFPLGALKNEVQGKPRRVQDQIAFYASLENSYFTKFRQALRDAGAKQPFCGSGWFGVNNTFFADLWANAKNMDYIDRHHYYPNVPGWKMDNGLAFDPTPALLKPELLLKLGGERVMSLPFSISEWANVLPNQYRLEAPPLMAFYGNELGGWDIPIHFAWDVHGYGGDTGFSNMLKWLWPVNEASTLCQYPALSEMIRRADIKPGPDVFIRNLSDAKALSGQPQNVAVNLSISGPYQQMAQQQKVNPQTQAAIYAAAVGRTGLAFTGKQDKPDFSIDLNKYLNLDKKEIHSATGELYWNYGAGYVTANAPKMQAAVGFYQGKTLNLKDCSIHLDGTVASVLVAPLDDQPLAQSNHILITAVGRIRNTGMQYSSDGTKILEVGKNPTRLEGVKGTVTFHRQGNCTVTALNPFGYKTVSVTPAITAGQITIPLDGKNKAAYYELKFE